MEQWFNKAALGIDLGTTYSAVGHVARTGRAELITNCFTGSITTPSIVLFDDSLGPIQVGENAKSFASVSGDRLVECAKRLMGTPRATPWNGPLSRYCPEDIATIILRHLVKSAERRLDVEVGSAVITVPAWFNDDARQATFRAGTRAGLDVIGILSEPTAAAIAWAMENILRAGLSSIAGRTILVYDLGGGTFDVSIVQVDPDGTLREIQRNGDVNLGGKDWDNWLTRYVCDAFEEEYGFALPRDHAEFRKIDIVESEKAKRWLSNADYRDLVAEYDHSARTKARVSRADFLAGTNELLKRTLAMVLDTLGDARLSPEDIDICLPVGGSTRMPQVRQALSDTFGANKVDFTMEQDEMVALGATLFMAQRLLKACDGQLPREDRTNVGLLDPRIQQMLRQLQVIEVSPRSYGISGRQRGNGAFAIDHFVRRNDPLPRKHSKTHSAWKNDQMRVKFGIFEGDSTNPASCIQLGRRELTLSQPTAAGTPLQFEIFVTSENMITVRMRDPHTGDWQSLTHVLDDVAVDSSHNRELLDRVDQAFL